MKDKEEKNGMDGLKDECMLGTWMEGEISASMHAWK